MGDRRLALFTSPEGEPRPNGTKGGEHFVAKRRRIAPRGDGDERSRFRYYPLEVFLVLTIVGVLAAVVVYSVSGFTDRSTHSACTASKSAIQTASEMYFLKTGRYASSTMSLKGAGFLTDLHGTVTSQGSPEVLTSSAGWHLDITWSTLAPPVFHSTSSC